MPKYYEITATNEYCGCDLIDYIECDDGQDIEQIAHEIAFDNASDYEYMVTHCFDNDKDMDIDEELDDYYENVDYSYKEITYEEYFENKE